MFFLSVCNFPKFKAAYTHLGKKKKNAGVIHCPRFVLSSMIRERGYKHNLVSVSLFSLPWKNFCA